MKFPYGLSDFATLIKEGYFYQDRTGRIPLLEEAGRQLIFIRPRRFGKSLFLDTLKELFEGNEPLFRGLYVHDRWDWKAARPAIRLSYLIAPGA